jgi:hypothetical protein
LVVPSAFTPDGFAGGAMQKQLDCPLDHVPHLAESGGSPGPHRSSWAADREGSPRRAK